MPLLDLEDGAVGNLPHQRFSAGPIEKAALRPERNIKRITGKRINRTERQKLRKQNTQSLGKQASEPRKSKETPAMSTKPTKISNSSS